MSITFLKQSSYLLLFISLFSCKPVLKSLSDSRVPNEVKEHFSSLVIINDSVKIPAPYKYTTEDGVDIYEMQARVENDELKGKLIKTKYLNELPGVPQSGSTQVNSYTVKIRCTFCCTGHNPQDCVKTAKAAKTLSKQKQCTNWRIIML